MHIVIAPNAFKNSLDAKSAAQAIDAGLQESDLVCTTTCFPVGDGGDGTGVLLTEQLGGMYVDAWVHDPLGRPIPASFGWIASRRTAVIEMAAASGLRLLSPDEYNPLQASSYGTGELIVAALEKGAEKIMLCVGGSATVDAGCGILHALGVRFFMNDQLIEKPVPANLDGLTRIDLSALDNRVRQCTFTVLCDVNNPLLGEQGAAPVFGPQKGADENSMPLLEKILEQFSNCVEQLSGKKISNIVSGGAAGGTAAGLYGLLHAQLVNGIDYFLDCTGFDQQLAIADLVITGEGRIDRQTLEGKAPFGVAAAARKRKIPVVALAGSIEDESDPQLQYWFSHLLNINQDYKGKDFLQQTAFNLNRTATRLGNEWHQKTILK
jgi:glycerate kinase